MRRIPPYQAFLALALAITAFQLATLAPQIGWNGDDYVGYIADASALLHGGPYGLPGYVINPDMDIGIAAYPPVYPLLLSLPMAVFGANFAVLDAWTVMLFGAALFALMLYARPLTGTAGALAAGAAAGLGPFVYDWKNGVMSEFCFVLMLFLSLLAERRFAAGRGGVATGLAMAAAVLTRAVGLALWPALLLADAMRARRLRGAALACVAGSVVVVVVGMLAVRADSFSQYLRLFTVNTELQVQGAAGAAPIGLAHGAVAVSLGERLGLISGNLRQAPGNLSMAWSFGAQFDPALKSGAIGLAGKALTLLLLGLGTAGLVLRVRRGISLAETFFVIELAGLMVMPHTLITMRLFLPLSLMLIFYVFVAARALQLRLGWRLPLAQGVCFLLLAASASIGYAGLLPLPTEGFTADRPPAVAFFDWVKANTPPQALLVSRSPRALIYDTGRRAVDYHLDHVDADFLAWERSLHADDIVLNIDLAEVKALARARGLPLTTAGLNQALDLYQGFFFGPYREKFPLVYANAWFRVYRAEP
jgi:hypothetical protein